MILHSILNFLTDKMDQKEAADLALLHFEKYLTPFQYALSDLHSFWNAGVVSNTFRREQNNMLKSVEVVEACGIALLKWSQAYRKYLASVKNPKKRQLSLTMDHVDAPAQKWLKFE